MAKLTSEQKSDLIDLVQIEPCLWDCSAKKFYKMARQKKTLWSNIAIQLGFEDDGDGEKIRKVWDNLRTQFVRKVNSRKSGSGADEEDQWEFTEKLMFLKPMILMKAQHRSTNLDESLNYETENGQQIENPDSSYNETEAEDIQTSSRSGMMRDVLIVHRNNGIETDLHESSEQIKSRKKKSKRPEEMTQNEKWNRVLKSMEGEEEENSLFGRSIAKTLDRLEVDDQMPAKIRILELLNSYKAKSN